jgi:hypothetical protein
MGNVSADAPTLKSGYTRDSMTLADADRIFSQSLFCKRIFQLITLDTFQPSPSWIAKFVGVTEREVAIALDALLTLDLIRRTPNGYEVTGKTYLREDTDVDTHLAFTEELLGEPKTQISGFANGSFATDMASIKKFHNSIREAINTLMEDSKTASKDFIYTMSFSAYKDSKEGES